ncbi:MAG: response regulator [Deltaproteobacteria bacterium]|nr:response regulator [Deltaproteobacteria bacterium]
MAEAAERLVVGRDERRVVFLVDDEERNLVLFERALAAQSLELHRFADGQEVIDAVRGGLVPDVVVTDVMMPRLDGFSLCAMLKADPVTRMAPVILVTGLEDVRDKVRGLEAGADDFLTKPFHPTELRARVRSLVRIKSLHDELERKNALLQDEKGILEELVRERTDEMELLTIGIVAALEKANALKDSDTGLHILRVCSYSQVLAIGLGLAPEHTAKVRRYASLHDVGKVGIPDAILKKQGKLTPEEYDQMKLHTVYGFELLGLARADDIARSIALSHHEKYDGTGYPHGLARAAIPIEARIVALADVYDALTTRRCYKEAFSTDTADRIIREESGRHFDPAVVDAMLASMDSFHRVRNRYAEAGEPPVAAPAAPT